DPIDDSDPIALSETATFDTKAVRYNAITRGLVLLYLFDRHAEAFKLAEETRDAAKVLMAQPTVPEHHFFHGMAAARVAAEGGPDASKAKSRLKQLVKLFRKLVVHCPDNNRHRLELLEAELSRLAGHHTQTFIHYGKAAAHAHQFEILHMEALDHERRSSLLKEMGLDGESALFALQAFEGYRAWGAHGKTKRMEEAMPKLTELRATVRSTTRSATTDIPLSRTAHATANSEPSSRGSSASSSLDVKTLLSVSQAVSEELAVDAVMRKVLEGALGHAGADRGLILLRRNGVLLVEAEALQGGSFTCPSLPVKGYTGLADTVLRPVERSGERLVIDDASTDSRTAADPHIVKSGVRSVLCMPLVRQGAPVGLLYLENHEAAAFTPDALEILRVLSTQAAISLDNALLYANLEARVTARTNELKDRSRAMRLVLDRVEQGLITLGPSGLVSEERSAIVDRWFGPCPANTIFGDYLRPHAPDTGAMFTLGWEALTDGFLPMELCIEQLPKRMVVGDRHFEFAYRPIVSESEQLLNCLVVMTDVTSEVDRERMEGEQRETMQLFERIARDRAGVVEFAAEARRMVQVISGRALDDLAEMKRVVHTLKGNSGIFGLHQIASVCQEIEAEMEEMEAMPSALMRVALADRWNAVDAKLGLWLGDQSSRLVEVQDEEYRSVLRALRLSEPRAEVVGKMDAWSLEPMEKRLRRIGDQVERLAERLGKAPLRLIIEPNRLRLDPEHWGTFWGSLVHVVRNAVDHGLETAEERSAAGKLEPGTITLRTVRAGDELRIEIADNGKGIHWDAIAAKASKSGLPSATHEERVRALFSDGISTRDEVTEISGRGVGTSVVLRECEARGGHIEVRSEAGKGTCFSFCFPAVEALRRTRTVPMHPEDIPKLHLPPRFPHIPLPLDGGN
ncbi:MAG: GAF domain-containing protein, partial [Myxococcales bacterium]